MNEEQYITNEQIDSMSVDDLKAVVKGLRVPVRPTVGYMWQKIHVSNNCLIEMYATRIPSKEEIDHAIKYLRLAKTLD